MLSIINTKVGESRGTPRIWLEQIQLSKHFLPGEELSFTVDTETKRIVLEAGDKPEGTRILVSKRTKNNRVKPLIEIKKEALTDLFGEPGTAVRVVINARKAVIERHGHDVRKEERESRFIERTRKGEPWRIGSLFSGGGILDGAMHEGLKRQGVESYTKFLVEQERKYIDALVSNQPELLRDDSVIVESPVERVELRNPPKVEGFLAGIPCTGASRAGRTKNGIKAAEFHDAAGACFFHTLQFVEATQPAWILFENVREYASSTSFAVITSVLRSWGYTVEVRSISGLEFGSIEDRNRMCMVAVSEGLEVFGLDLVSAIEEGPSCLGDLLEDIPLEDPTWRTYDYLAEKEVRDAVAGKGFKRVLVDETTKVVPTLRRLYHKAGSCDTFVKHPDGVRSRLFTPIEHARIKKIPLHFIEGVGRCIAHEIMGQGVSYCAFTAIANSLGQWAKRLSGVESTLMLDAA